MERKKDARNANQTQPLIPTRAAILSRTRPLTAWGKFPEPLSLAVVKRRRCDNLVSMSDTNRELIGNRATEEANIQGLDVEVSWTLEDVENLDQKAPDKYTGPGGHVWKMRLWTADSHEFLHSVGFTPKEVSFCETDYEEAVDARIGEAIGKIKKTVG